MTDLNLIIKDNNVFCTSLQISECFEKNHYSILRDIKELISKIDVINTEHHYFIESTYKDSYDRQQKMYLINRDGFCLLVMGYTGDKSRLFKLEFINKFNEMENNIFNIYNKKSYFKKKDIESKISDYYSKKFNGKREYYIKKTNERIDILTDDTIYEVKNINGYKQSLGQLISYNHHLNNKYKMCAILYYGMNNKKNIDFSLIETLLNKNNISVIFVDSNYYNKIIKHILKHNNPVSICTFSQN